MLFTKCGTPQHGKFTKKKGSCTKFKVTSSKLLCIAHLLPLEKISAQNHRLGPYSYRILTSLHKIQLPMESGPRQVFR